MTYIKQNKDKILLWLNTTIKKTIKKQDYNANFYVLI